MEVRTQLQKGINPVSRFGKMFQKPIVGKSLKEMVGTRRLELLTSTVSR